MNSNILQHRGDGMINNSNGRGVGIPIPGNKGPRKTINEMRTPSSGFFDSSDDSISGSSRSNSPLDGDGFPSMSSSYHGGGFLAGNAPLNVYGTSPRTSVMFNYYSSPKTSFSRSHQSHLVRTRSSDESHHHGVGPPHSQSDHVSLRQSNEFSGTENEKNRKSDNLISSPLSKAKPPAIPYHQMQQLDLRPRAWSESDKNRNKQASAMQNSRMSALRKLKMKLGQKAPLKRQKSHDEDDKNKSAASITSLEKVEEGRQLDTPCLSRSSRITNSDAVSITNTTASLHQEHETRKKGERRHGVVKLPSPPSLSQVNENPEDHLIYQRFFEEHNCYDLMPTSSKLVVLDTRLEVKKAFHAIIENSLRCAPLWDNDQQEYVGLLTVSDFVSILLAYEKCPNKKLEDLENQKISCWRQVLNPKKTLVHVPPQSSLYHALKVLTEENIRRLAIMQPELGDIFYVTNHRRILHFLHLFMNELPKPKYMSKTIGELLIGTWKDVSTIHEDSPVIDALKLLDQHKVSALPVVDDPGRVTDMFTKTDVLVLAGEQLFYDLSIPVKQVISLHAAVDSNEISPTVVRTMPGSPALVRRKIPANNHQPHCSTPVQNHAFLRNANNTPRKMPSPLVGSSVISNRKSTGHSDNRKSREITQHTPLIRTPSKGAKDPGLGKGDNTSVLSPPKQVYLHRRRHLSSHFGKSSSISSHLVTVTRDDTLETVVNNIVTADVLQAVIVDDFDHVQGVISVGDILRFMVYPTKDGKIVWEEDKQTENDVVDTKTQTSNTTDEIKLGSRTRAASDDSDVTSANARKHIGNDSGYSCELTSELSNGEGMNLLNSSDKSKHASSVNNAITSPPMKKQTCMRALSSGEKMQRL